MDGRYGGIQWIQHHSNHGVDMKSAGHLLIDPQPPQMDELMANDGSGGDYLADDDPNCGDADIDQIAAENLIFMARDGQMVTEIIATAGTDENGAVVVAASDGTHIDCNAVIQQAATAALMQQHEDAGEGGGVYEGSAAVDQYADTTPQMVTEEVITDDWVQHQGEERVEIPAEQIIGSGSQVLLDIEVPLPTVQDEYTAMRPYPCDFCSRRFRKKVSLMNHMVAHQNDRPHLCKLCGSRFFRRPDLISHLKAHAEATDPDLDDADFVNIVTETSPAQRHPNDHYYEQDWSVPTDTISVPKRSSRNHMIATTTNRNSPSTASNTAQSKSVVQRGRISRLKPKEEPYAVSVQSARTSNAVAIPYDVADSTSSFTGGVELQRNYSPAQQEKKEQHFPIIDESKPFVCQQCGLAFTREKAMLSHAKNHRNDSPYECQQCSELFWDQTSLQEHQKSHNFEESNSEYDPAEGEEETQSESESEKLYGEFYCSECGMSFHRQDLLRRHTKAHAKVPAGLVSASGDLDKNRHCCNTCGETFAEALDLLAHAEIHARYPPFKCVLCGESFFEEPTIKRHLQSQHPNELTENSCILCGKECRDRKALIKHAWDHSREKCHSCSKCGKNFHNKARLKRHMSSHRDKSVQCDVCHEEFPDGRTLSNHRHSHSATSAGKLFPCHECGKTFGSRSSQQIHVRIHTGERPYGCRFCWKAFADGGTLRKHERIHTGEKPYACSVCPRAFNQRVVLREHIRSHHSGLDAKRGTYYCSVCSADLSSSADLIQHLIQHSDMNTAMQRQPVTGPRKYKRRRKLKPHEIARLRRESKQNGNGSDIDISDFDMDNVDDLLGITESNETANSAISPTPATAKKDLTTANSKRNQKDSTDECNINTSNNAKNIAENKYVAHGKEQAEDGEIGAKEKVDSDVLDQKKKRYNSASSDKLWPTKLIASNSHEESYKSFLSNLENTLQSIDTLVVGNNSAHESGVESSKLEVAAVKKRKSKQESTARRIQQGQIMKMDPKTTNSSSSVKTRRQRSENLNKQTARPHMIHTERSRIASSDGNKRRTKSLVTRTQTANIDLLSKSTIVDDYEIISPDLQPPKQISSSPLYIKQEHDNNHQSQKPNVSSATSIISGGQNQRSNDLYDAHLLLEASTLRKEVFDKYNPNIVNDLEEILRSPLKSDKCGSRQRFTSESSTQFLTEQSEEEQHLIKIEPTSPDLREIVNGASCSNSTGADGVGVDDVQIASERRCTRSTRRVRLAASKKYLEFESNLKSTPSAGGAQKRGSTSSSNVKSAKVSRRDSLTSAAVSKSVETASNYLDYSVVDGFNTVSNSTSASAAAVAESGSFASISAVVSAADATAAAAAAAAPVASPSRKSQRYFECEMCSAVFSDRAQLLDHVPIHI